MWGLGGGLDAAAVIRTLNDLTGAQLGEDALLPRGCARARRLCLLGGTALAGGPRRGPRSPAAPAGDPAVICMPHFTCSTPELFTRLDALRTRCRPDTDGLVAALRAGDLAGAARRMYNVFEDALTRRCAQAVGEIKRLLLEKRAWRRHERPGSAVYGLFADEERA